jgi:hypothetical protein
MTKKKTIAEEQRELKEKNALLVRAERRFKKTRLENIEPSKKDEDTKEYVLEKHNFRFILYLNREAKEGHLWILKPQGTMFEDYDISNKDYAPIIERMYERMQQRVSQKKVREKNWADKESERNLRRL